MYRIQFRYTHIHGYDLAVVGRTGGFLRVDDALDGRQRGKLVQQGLRRVGSAGSDHLVPRGGSRATFL